MYSFPINNLIAALKKLPSVGQHTAERFVFYLLKTGKKEVTELITALKELVENVKSCSVCWNFSDQSPCKICSDQRRDHGTICVALDPQDLEAIEKTAEFTGVYHLLRGLVDPSDQETISKIKTRELLERIKAPSSLVKEVILALNSDVPGEITMLYLEKELLAIKPHLKITRLARGLPMGADLRYADAITLSSAFKHRIKK